MIYVSTSSLDFDLGELLRENRKLPSGLGFELGSGLSRQRAMDVLAMARSCPGTRFLIHNYFPPLESPFVLNLASGDPNIRQQSIAFCLNALGLCSELGAPFFSLHAGLAVDPAPGDLGHPLIHLPAIQLEEARALFRRSVERISEQARHHGVRVLIENNVLAPFNAPDGVNRLALLCSPKELSGFRSEYPYDNVGLLLDVGHLKVSARTLGFDLHTAFWEAAPWAEALHLHDNDGENDDHWLFKENAWFMPHLEHMREHAALIIESFRSPWPDLLAAAKSIDDVSERRRISRGDWV